MDVLRAHSFDQTYYEAERKKENNHNINNDNNEKTKNQIIKLSNYYLYR